MKKINFFKLVSLLVVVVFAVACKDNYPESHSVDTLIALDKKDVTLHAGESVNLSAKINFQKDGKNVATTIEKKINWATSDTLVAKIDANGKVTAVKGGTAIITAECQGTKETCAISVKDIFVAGSLELSDSEKLAVIWQKCDTGAFVMDSLKNAEFAAMEVNEQGIYYAGIHNGTAKVWKDKNVLYELRGENITITSMCIDGGDVYVTGYNTISEDNIVARLWKNKEEIGLDLMGNVSYAYDVAIEKGVVYVVGSQLREETGVGKMHDAMLWTDTIGTAGKTSMSLPIPDKYTSKHAQARTICINNGVVYVGGSVGYDSEGKPYIWKDGKEDVVVEKFETAKAETFVKNIKFVNNELYAFYDTNLLMGNKKSEDAKDYMIQAQGSGYADVAVSEGSVFVVAQGYPQYANGKTNECDSSYDDTALATILLKDNGMVDFLPRSMRAKGGEEKTKYPKSNAVAIGIR